MLKRRARLLFFFLCAAALAVAAANAFLLQRPLEQVQKDGIEVAVHYRHYVDVRTLVFDVRELPAGTRPDDVTRVLLAFAGRMKDRSFSEVRLAYQGREKFLVHGDAFRNLGQHFGTEHLYRLDGTRAFAGAPDDFIAWHRAWYRDELTEKIKAAMEQAA